MGQDGDVEEDDGMGPSPRKDGMGQDEDEDKDDGVGRSVLGSLLDSALLVQLLLRSCPRPWATARRLVQRRVTARV
jgi:hypothetical protein